MDQVIAPGYQVTRRRIRLAQKRATDRALIGVMVYSFARVSAVVGMKVEDYYQQGKRWWISLIALNGMAFDLATPHGRMIATVLAGIAEFERDLSQERIRSGIAAAKARGKRFGRQPGQRPKSDRLAPKVLALIEQGRSYRLVGRELRISKNTVADIVKRNRAGPESI